MEENRMEPLGEIPQEPERQEETRGERGFAQTETVRQECAQARTSGPWEPYNRYAAGDGEPDRPEDKKKYKKEKSAAGRRVTAVLLVLVLLAGSCLGTGIAVSRHWEKQALEMKASLQQQINELQKKVDSNASVGNGISVSGTPVSTDGLTPAQVYAKNVRSVVAVANQGTTNIYGQISETASSGSGFILTSDGYVVTNYHVVEGATRLTVITYDGTEYPATLMGSNATNDIALLKIEGENFPAVTIGRSDDLIVGDMVVAIGNPLGELTSTQTVGYVSAVNRTINVDGTPIDMMQTDAAINSGNSGGPLFNMKGEVVGITTAKYSGNTGSGASIEGIGFAIPIDDVIGMITDLRDYGYITGAYLGVRVRSLDSETAALYSLPMGVYVESVDPGTCAEKAGVKSKDIIVGLGEYEVKGYTDLARALRKYKAGDETTLRIYRGGKEIVLQIVLDEKPREDSGNTSETTPVEPTGQMPQTGNFFEWYQYLEPFFKGKED